MEEHQIRKLLDEVRQGTCSDEEALQRLRLLPFESLGFATLDHHRSLRTGFPEVILAEGKTPEQVATIFARLAARHDVVMATRAQEAHARAVAEEVPEAVHHDVARIVAWRREGSAAEPSAAGGPRVAVVSAGTADLPVAEEAAVTAELAGCSVRRTYDVGVAGLHRLLDRLEELSEARVLVVVAGMEGALPSVVGGLVAAPVVAVPRASATAPASGAWPRCSGC